MLVVVCGLGDSGRGVVVCGEGFAVDEFFGASEGLLVVVFCGLGVVVCNQGVSGWKVVVCGRGVVVCGQGVVVCGRGFVVGALEVGGFLVGSSGRGVVKAAFNKFSHERIVEA